MDDLDVLRAALAALETPGDLVPGEMTWIIDDLRALIERLENKRLQKAVAWEKAA